MNEQMKFVAALQRGYLGMVEADSQFGGSRKTGYKILTRCAEWVIDGLRGQPRAPHSHPNQA